MYEGTAYGFKRARTRIKKETTPLNFKVTAVIRTYDLWLVFFKLLTSTRRTWL